MTQAYGVRDVEKLLRLPRSTLRALIAAGFVTPTRGPRGAWQFTFQDLIVLRTAQALAEASVPQRRITRSVRELRRKLPATMPLSGLSIGAVGDHVVVREGGARWQAETGQYVLEFDGDPAGGTLSVIAHGAAAEEAAAPVRRGAPHAADPQQWFDEAAALERNDIDRAVNAYRNAIAADPAFVDAPINLGRLLHEAGRHAEAEGVYREALVRCGRDSLLLFNLGVLLDDQGRAPEARDAYEAALRVDPGLADCHYNLALVYEALAQPKQALRHLARYRALTGASAK